MRSIQLQKRQREGWERSGSEVLKGSVPQQKEGYEAWEHMNRKYVKSSFAWGYKGGRGVCEGIRRMLWMIWVVAQGVCLGHDKRGGTMELTALNLPLAL